MLTLMASLLLISSAITNNHSITQAFATPTTTEEAWSVYSGNGVTFEYPSTWYVEQKPPNWIEIVVTNPNRDNGITITLPSPHLQEEVSKYSSLQDFAKDFAGKQIGYTTIDEFTEKYFNGFPAAAGKMSYLDTTYYAALIDYHGQIYAFSYHDVANEFDGIESQRTLLKIIGTFGFL